MLIVGMLGLTRDKSLIMIKGIALLTTLVLTLLAQPVWADTSNRAIQISPVPAIYVGGVGLLCVSKMDETEFLLLTRDRKYLGVAKFEDDDITYEKSEIYKQTPNLLAFESDVASIKVNRKSLEAEIKRRSPEATYYVSCEASSISDVHKAAEQKLKDLLSGNRI